MVMVKRRNGSRGKAAKNELDGVYILKLVMYLIVGSQWVFFVDTELTKQIPLPVGLVIGGLFALHEHFQIDRKIEIAVLLVACLVGFWSQTGLIAAVL